MPEVPRPGTDTSVKVRQLSGYQFSWIAGEPGRPGTYTPQLVRDQGPAAAAAGPAHGIVTSPLTDTVRTTSTTQRGVTMLTADQASGRAWSTRRRRRRPGYRSRERAPACQGMRGCSYGSSSGWSGVFGLFGDELDAVADRRTGCD